VTWAKEPMDDQPGGYRLLRKRYDREHWRQMGVVVFDHVAVRPWAEALAQDVILVLNNPVMVDEWVAMRQQAWEQMREVR